MPDTVKVPSVPTDVKLDAVTDEFNTVPVSVLAFAVTVMFVEPLKLVPFIVRAVCNTVAVLALPLTLPVIVFVTVKLVNVPTDVKLEAVTPLASVVPVNVLAFAVTVIAAVPSKFTPLIARAVCSFVAVAALPLMLPVIVFVTVKLVNVPTDVSDEAVTPLASVVPVNVAAFAVTVIAAEPSKFTPLIARAVCNTVAVLALPLTLPVIVFVTVNADSVPTDVKLEAVTPLANTVPVNVVAFAVTVISLEPSKFTPLIARAVLNTVAVPALPLMLPVIVFVTVKSVNVPTDVIFVCAASPIFP